MSSKAHAERLSRAIELSGLAEPVTNGFAENRINVLCRVPQGSEAKWNDLVYKILLATDAEQGEAHGWQAHLCRHYFLRETKDGKKMVWGWNISVQSQDMSTSLDFIMRVIKGEPVRPAHSRVEVEEMELTGLTRPRNMPKPGGKGAYTVEGGDNFRPSGARR